MPDIASVYEWSMALYVTLLICVVIVLYVLLVVIILCLRSHLVVSVHRSINLYICNDMLIDGVKGVP